MNPVQDPAERVATGPVSAQAEAPAKTQPRFWNVPNTLTVGRLVLAVFVFAFISWQWYVLALAAFVIAAISDALDGYFARLLGQDTAIGRQLDPLIDKVIVSGCYIYLATIAGTGVYPWMVTAIVVRELLDPGSAQPSGGPRPAVWCQDGRQAQDDRPVPVDHRHSAGPLRHRSTGCLFVDSRRTHLACRRLDHL